MLFVSITVAIIKEGIRTSTRERALEAAGLGLFWFDFKADEDGCANVYGTGVKRLLAHIVIDDGLSPHMAVQALVRNHFRQGAKVD